MKIPTTLLHRVLLDVGLQMIDTIDYDYREICSRYEKEGMSFLTITLPTLDDALLAGLRRGYLTRRDFPGFRPYRRGGSLPALLSGFFRRIFHSDGSIIDEPDVCAIFAIRQVSRLFKKVELPCSSRRVTAAYERYISNDREVDWRCPKGSVDAGLFASICGFLWSDLEDLTETLFCHPGIFGIGATAERRKRNERYTVTEWPARAENSFPSSYHAVHSEDSEALSSIRFLSEEQEQPVRVVQVPKTLKTPRTISVEPSYMMLMQQSIAKPLMVYLESKRFGFKSIRFTDQSVNSDLARLGSIDGSLATIDLKDASDMIDFDLVTNIFHGPCPTFLKLIQDCRTTRAKLPDGTIVPLKKFASMGSALCFPIESMVFFTIIMYALVKESGRVPSRRFLLNLARKVAVYGDDIIVDSSMAPVVIASLKAFGLKVNDNKSFHTGLFRESCGGDYYKGVNVTPTYVRHWDDTGTLRAPSHLVAYTALSNTFYMKGLWNACQYLRDGISSRIRTRIPLSQHPIGVLHYSSFVRSDGLSYDSKLHGYRVRGLGVRSTREQDAPTNVDGFLLRAFQPGFIQDRLVELESRLRQPTSSQNLNMVWRRYSADIRFSEFYTAEHDSEISGSHSGGYWSAEPCVDIPDRGVGTSYAEMLRGTSPKFHGELFPWDRGGTRMGRRFAHLYGSVASSLELSDRPYALCLKRTWTASLAGLSW
jgi:hypothetical protein